MIRSSTCFKIKKVVIMKLKFRQIRLFNCIFRFTVLATVFHPALSFSQAPLTPLEESHFTKLTSHAEMMVYLEKIDQMTNQVEMKIIGKSVEGRDLPLVMISGDKTFGSCRENKPIVFFFAQQHGNEPSGKEAALILIRELAVGKLINLLKEPRCVDHAHGECRWWREGSTQKRK